MYNVNCSGREREGKIEGKPQADAAFVRPHDLNLFFPSLSLSLSGHIDCNLASIFLHFSWHFTDD